MRALPGSEARRAPEQGGVASRDDTTAPQRRGKAARRHTPGFSLRPLLEWFGRRGVEIYTGAADIVVPTAPVQPDTKLLEELRGRAGQVFAIGDCVEAGMIVDAVAAGWATAREI